jgi:hypothetical protein
MTREFPNNLYVTGTLINTTGVISGAGTAYHSGHLSSPPVISGVRVTRSLVLYVCFVYRCLSFCTLSVLLRYTDSDCPFGIFKLFSLNCCLIWSFCITARHTHTVAQIDFFVYIKSCQYSMFYTNCSWNFSCIH